MKLIYNNIFGFIKHTAFLVVFMSLLLQTITISVTIFIENDTELVEIDWEEDSDEEEKQEKTDEKIEPPIFESYTTPFLYVSVMNCHQLQHLPLDFSLEIPIPPPEQV